MKNNAVKTIPCPACKRGEAVNKEAAFLAFHSKPYAKKRKALKKSPRQPLPQVGAALTLEQLMLSPELPPAFARPHSSWKADEENDERFVRAMFFVLALVIGLLAIYFELRLTAFKLIFIAAAIGLFVIWIMAGEARLHKHFEGLEWYRQTWLCLRCGHEWVPSPENTVS